MNDGKEHALVRDSFYSMETAVADKTFRAEAVVGDATYWVYILANAMYGTLYVGVTNSLERRVAEHRAGETPGFTKRYNVRRLVFYRGFGEVTEAIHFEKQLKRWRREWKMRLIEAENLDWTDLYLEMMALPPLHPDLVGLIEQPRL